MGSVFLPCTHTHPSKLDNRMTVRPSMLYKTKSIYNEFFRTACVYIYIIARMKPSGQTNAADQSPRHFRSCPLPLPPPILYIHTACARESQTLAPRARNKSQPRPNRRRLDEGCCVAACPLRGFFPSLAGALSSLERNSRDCARVGASPLARIVRPAWATVYTARGDDTRDVANHARGGLVQRAP